MKKISLSFIFVISIFYSLTAQQLPIFSQYFFNDYVLNPAFTGNERYSPIQLTYRNQWAGFNGPSSISAGGHTYIANKKIGIGGTIFSDDMGGAISQRGLALNFSYRITINDRSYFSAGVSGLFNQYAYDGSDIKAAIHTDPSLFSQTNQINPDASLGVAYVLDDRFKLGFSANQLVEKSVKSWNDVAIGSANNRLIREYNFSASYLAKVSNGIDLETYGIMRTTFKSPFQFDLGSRLLYKGKYYGGLAYRHLDALSVLLGFKFERFVIGYGYDITLSRLNSYSYGSHELTLSYRLKVDKKRIVTRRIGLLDQF